MVDNTHSLSAHQDTDVQASRANLEEARRLLRAQWEELAQSFPPAILESRTSAVKHLLHQNSFTRLAALDTFNELWDVDEYVALMVLDRIRLDEDERVRLLAVSTLERALFRGLGTQFVTDLAHLGAQIGEMQRVGRACIEAVANYTAEFGSLPNGADKD